MVLAEPVDFEDLEDSGPCVLPCGNPQLGELVRMGSGCKSGFAGALGCPRDRPERVQRCSDGTCHPAFPVRDQHGCSIHEQA